MTMPTPAPASLRGVYVANVTPFRVDSARSIDVTAYREHVAWLANHGVDGVVPFGTNGEGPSVATHEKSDVLEALAGDDVVVDSGIGILPTVAEGNLTDTVALLERINDLPVVAVLVLPPYYFKPVGAEGLRAFYERVLEVSRHAVLAYHIPKYAVPVPVELVTSLPLWGVKDSDGKPEYSTAVRASGRGVFLGTEDDLPGRLPQVEGCISALANIVPEQVVELYRRVAAGENAEARELSEHLQRVRALTKEYASPGLLKLLAQARHGNPMGTVRPPLVPVPGSYDVAGALARLAVNPPPTGTGQG
jgi:dihydrodipicolinate synthase/N-acetylneuraminate lyase